MSITKDTPLSELMHSDDELMHWKYVKREKKNGKWRYYYAYPNKNGSVIPGVNTEDMTKREINSYKNRQRINRHMEAAKLWMDSRLDRLVVDAIKGVNKPPSWSQAKNIVDSNHIDDDPDLFIGDLYKNVKD